MSTFNWATSSNGTNTSLTTTSSSNAIVAGDFLLLTAILASSINQTLSMSTDWTVADNPGCVIQPSSSTTVIVPAVFYKVAGASETGAYTVSWSGSLPFSWSLLDYSAPSSSVLDSSPVAQSQGPFQFPVLTSPSVTASFSTDLEVGVVFSAQKNGTITPSSDWNNRVKNIAGNSLIVVSDLQLTSTGVKTGLTVTTQFNNTADRSVTMLLTAQLTTSLSGMVNVSGTLVSYNTKVIAY